MVSSKKTALLFLALLLFSCAGMASAARGLEETAPDDDYPAEAPAPEQDLLPPFPGLPSFPKVELPPMPPGFSFPEPEPEADEP
ncbi:hypothetical protein CFC21_028854 [Triticum aestivum]|uniref:Uncharacterized protein n=2 Tax=Triticum aestivum TaxID=4565 RepID=A0A3B6DA67_WHEAT|nr:hypothetical protein CFC21_028854 [Triticum aestivum]